MVHPIASIYRWQGAVHHTTEARALVRPRLDLVEKLTPFVVERHAYDVPHVTPVPGNWRKPCPILALAQAGLEHAMDAAELQKAIDEGVTEAYFAHGYIKDDGDGADTVDKTELHEAIYKAIKTAIVTEPKERSERALTRGGLTKRVFPNSPGANGEWDELDPVQRGVWEQLVKDVWNPTNPNYSGPVQRLVGERDEKLVLIKAKTTVDGTPGVDVVYLTDSEELIFTDFIGPLKSSVRRAADRLAKNAALVSTRNKDLAPKAGREVDSGMKAAASLAKSTLELMSGTSES